MILIYETEDRTEWIERARGMAEARFPGVRQAIRNPHYHAGRSDVERCEAVIVSAKYSQVISDYTNAGIGVLTLEEHASRETDPSLDLVADAAQKPRKGRAKES